MRKRERLEPQPHNGGAFTKPLSLTALRKKLVSAEAKLLTKKERKRNHCKSRFSATMANWWGDLRDL